MTRPRYSLRTLFIVVTLLCIVGGSVGYNLNWIRERQLVSKRHHILKTDLAFEPQDDKYARRKKAGLSLLKLRPKVPWPLHWFGETGFSAIYTKENVAVAEVERIRALFPEAEILTISDEHMEWFTSDPPLPWATTPRAPQP